MENVYEIIETSSSDETDNSTDEENKELNELNSEFLNYTNVDEYLKNRNSLFTKDIEQIDLEVSSSASGGSDFTYDFGSLNKYKNIIGIELIDTFIQLGTTSAYPIINIIVNEIPYIACIQNNKGKHLITKIILDSSTLLFRHELGGSMINKYFFPISLNKLNVKFEQINGDPASLIWGHISLIFRLTIVNNLNLLK